VVTEVTFYTATLGMISFGAEIGINPKMTRSMAVMEMIPSSAILVMIPSPEELER
jgi:hypothetical protein